jgi:anthranilate phosphoribosyltransferase
MTATPPSSATPNPPGQLSEAGAVLWPGLLSRLAARDSLSAQETAEAMRSIMQGDATPAQIGGFLMALRTKGETVEEIEGLAAAMLELARPVKAGTAVIDTCGTAGTGPER